MSTEQPMRLDMKTTRMGKEHGLYGDSIIEIDWASGEILNSLDKLNFGADTLECFVPEYGCNFRMKNCNNGVYTGWKLMGTLEGGIRGPAIIRWPGVVKNGSVAIL
jgi:arylsulfatase A-like enzyme